MIKSIYLERPCCTKCDWFSLPEFYYGVPISPSTICPKCGSKLKFVIGRYVYKVNKKFFGLKKEYELIDFEKKD